MLSGRVLVVGCEDSDGFALQGYVEGELVYVAAESTAKISQIMVKPLQSVAAGQILVVLDDETEKNQLATTNNTLAGDVATLTISARANEIAIWIFCRRKFLRSSVVFFQRYRLPDIILIPHRNLNLVIAVMPRVPLKSHIKKSAVNKY